MAVLALGVLVAACSSTPAAPASTPTATSVAAPTTTTKVTGLTGFGATLANWNATHSKDADYEGEPAYGPIISTPEGPTPQFINVMAGSGHISQYIESLPDDTSLAAAKTAVLANLPADAVARSLNLSNTAAAAGQTSSCAFWNLSSAQLGEAVGSPLVSIEMAYDDSNGAPYWRPNDVNTLSFIFGRGLTTDVC
jgi:hypothetical protein